MAPKRAVERSDTPCDGCDDDILESALYYWTMIFTVDIADVTVPTALRLLYSTPRVSRVDGLRHAQMGLAAPLGSDGKPDPHRVAMIATWDDHGAVDRFRASSPTAAHIESGWQVRLEPVRAIGEWPGLPGDVPRSRQIECDGPAVVLTLGRLRARRALKFLQATALAGQQVVEAPGMIWSTGLARPPFVATVSLWDNADALRDYAYGDASSPHVAAMAADRGDPFHSVSAFIRCRPVHSSGGLDGTNPLHAHWLGSSSATAPPLTSVR